MDTGETGVSGVEQLLAELARRSTMPWFHRLPVSSASFYLSV
jgi:hypothetical protein